MEKAILVQLKDYITSHSFIICCQSAFRKNHSTTTALHRVICDILDGINENDITAICFIDLKKCFDTIDHTILFKKLQMYGFRGTTHAWFETI